MRSLFLVLGLCAALIVASAGGAAAVGMYSVGKESCPCPTLTAQGRIPDTLNQIAQFPLFGVFSAAVERISVEVKAILGQFGVRTATAGEPHALVRSLKPRRLKARRTRKVKLPPKAK